MERRDFIKTSILGTGILMNPNILYANTSKKFSLNFSYKINFDSAKQIKLYIPLPISTDFQQPYNLNINGNYKHHSTEYQNGVPFIYTQYDQDSKLKYISINLNILLNKMNTKNPQKNPKQYLENTRYIRTDGMIKKLALNLKTNDNQKTANKIYEWIINHIDEKNAKNTKGIRSIQTKSLGILFSGENISATSLFVSLCRACNIPATEAFGIDLYNPQNTFSSKAEIYLASTGWVPYDIITPILDQSFNGIGTWKEDFILMNYARDFCIQNTFLASFDTAFGLVDGDRLDYYENKNFSSKFVYEQIS
ncbi:transglutaminase-like domain-containing protein [Helicobacter sp. 13S00477-4]|uniref:transglutaminase-like domain-containing protein n=1 Tax=Helicobacter sp. 13S00477-4 TaxID=1905759 RepID=UPI000BA61A25|nr:transglutaminase-like domain-containing protein [Helicobacter sp. 13S00477-4]PAF50694.1 hypothetical protein BKH44_07140 [Helicobacter sp. 13S00477-4]